MKIKEYKIGLSIVTFFYAYPEEHNFYIGYAYDHFYVSEDWKGIIFGSKEISFINLSEKFQIALQDPLFEIQCMREWEIAPLYHGTIKESNYFDY